MGLRGWLVGRKSGAEVLSHLHTGISCTSCCSSYIFLQVLKREGPRSPSCVTPVIPGCLPLRREGCRYLWTGDRLKAGRKRRISCS